MREKERLEALRKKDKHDHSAIASTEVKQRLQVDFFNCLLLLKFIIVDLISLTYSLLFFFLFVTIAIVNIEFPGEQKAKGGRCSGERGRPWYAWV